MNNTNAPKFTCKTCGGHNLIVSHVWIISTAGASVRWKEWGALKDNHQWQYLFREEVGENTAGDLQTGEFDEFFVNCETCGSEVEFGWSQQDRCGNILPVEFSDFMPAESWPDPKYSSIWQQNGWLQTMDVDV